MPIRERRANLREHIQALLETQWHRKRLTGEKLTLAEANNQLTITLHQINYENYPVWYFTITYYAAQRDLLAFLEEPVAQTVSDEHM